MDKPGDYTLTLNIHLKAGDEFDADVLATMMEDALNEGINTNCPGFFAEMFDYALTERIRSAFRDMVEAICQKIFGRK